MSSVYSHKVHTGEARAKNCLTSVVVVRDGPSHTINTPAAAFADRAYLPQMAPSRVLASQRGFLFSFEAVVAKGEGPVDERNLSR